MLGIIGAMPIEIEKIKSSMTDIKHTVISGMDFYTGAVEGEDVALCISGVGKVNAAAAAQTMILKYAPDAVINTGVAGGLDTDLKVGDIVVASAVVEHDMDTSGVGDPVGYISGLNKIYIETDDEISGRIYEIAENIAFTKRGIIASGDQFICTDEARGRIIDLFGASAAEMEGASIGHICAMNGVKFAVIRAVSDNANSDSHMSFAEFTELAAERSIKILLEYIKSVKEDKNGKN
ncbi:MAG: 5'-methylthioadenosine/adenosylhomocysteine nucleosidase [Firmicutes bacterium]|nr:5'-methylthioadenosine/adenosylhomocysteine nucleosidase [Bacillota bacterium]